MASSEPYTAETFRMFPDLQVIARMGVGYDAIDLEAARDHEVPVMIAAGTNDTTVAETAVALLLALARDLGRYFETTAAGGWVRPPTTELRDKTIGLVGLGRIGRAVVQRLQGFEVEVVAAEPYPDADFVAEHGVELVSIDEVFRRANFVSLHTPMNDGNARGRKRTNPRAYAKGLLPGQYGSRRTGGRGGAADGAGLGSVGRCGAGRADQRATT